jgi:hypothetical protein
MDQKKLDTTESLGAALDNCGFSCAFSATDGDSQMLSSHKQTFEQFESFDLTENLETIVNHFTSNREKPLKFWPISNFLHLVKNSRSTIVKRSLAFDSQSKEISGELLQEFLDLGRPFTAQNPLDLIRDNLALELFKLGDLFRFSEQGNIIRASFLVPFMSLNLVIRNSRDSNNTRVGLLQATFSVFFRMAKNYPTTSKAPGI